MKGKVIVVLVVTAVVFAGAGFWGGATYRRSNAPGMPDDKNFKADGIPGPRGAGNMGGAGNGGFVSGEIVSSDDKSVTVKKEDGSTKIVYFSDSTSLLKSDKTDKSNLKTGEKVTVDGSSNQDGSIAAQSIQIQP